MVPHITAVIGSSVARFGPLGEYLGGLHRRRGQTGRIHRLWPPLAAPSVAPEIPATSANAPVVDPNRTSGSDQGLGRSAFPHVPSTLSDLYQQRPTKPRERPPPHAHQLHLDLRWYNYVNQAANGEEDKDRCLPTFLLGGTRGSS